MKKIKYFLNIRKLPFRFLLLLFSVGSGIGLVWVGADKIYYFFDSILEIEIKSNYSFIALLLGILTFLTLWFFRTYDVREQIGQQDFHDALRMLADDKLISQEIAVLRLIDISKKTKIYDDTIKLAFIKRMKAPYKYKENEFRNYAQHIFCWLGERYRVKDKLDLVSLDLGYQDFRARDNDGKKIKHFRAKKGNYFVLDSVNLRGAKLTGVDLRGADLTRADLTGAKLKGADLRGADLTRAVFYRTDLTEANLTGTDLRGANLTEAYLRGADLARADLTGAKLKGADLTGAILTEADLRGANLTGAKLEGANLTEADLANLTEADLAGANLTGAKLEGANLVNKIGADFKKMETSNG